MKMQNASFRNIGDMLAYLPEYQLEIEKKLLQEKIILVETTYRATSS